MSSHEVTTGHLPAEAVPCRRPSLAAPGSGVRVSAG